MAANPVKLPGFPNTGLPHVVDLSDPNLTLGTIINALLPRIIVLAGLILLLMLIWGGIVLMTSGGDPAKTKDGYGKITGGLIGFLIIFITYFVAQIVQVVLGVKIL